MRRVFGSFWLLMAGLFLLCNSVLMHEGAMEYANTQRLQIILGSVAFATPWILAVLPFQVGMTFKPTLFGLRRPTAGTIVVFAAYGIFITYNVLNGSNALTTSRVSVVAEKQQNFNQQTALSNQRAALLREQEALPPYRPAATVAALIAAEKQSKRWKSSDECRDATSKLSRDFCSNILKLDAEHSSAVAGADLQGKINTLDQQLAAAGPASAEVDPQAAALARWTGQSPEDIRAATGTFGPLALEFGALTFLVFAMRAFGWSHNLDAKTSNTAKEADPVPTALIPDREAMNRIPVASADVLTQRRQLAEWFFRENTRHAPAGSLPEDEWFDHYTAICRRSKDEPFPVETFRRIAMRFVPTIQPIDGKTYYQGLLPLMTEAADK